MKVFQLRNTSRGYVLSPMILNLAVNDIHVVAYILKSSNEYIQRWPTTKQQSIHHKYCDEGSKTACVSHRGALRTTVTEALYVLPPIDTKRSVLILKCISLWKFKSYSLAQIACDRCSRPIDYIYHYICLLQELHHQNLCHTYMDWVAKP